MFSWSKLGLLQQFSGIQGAPLSWIAVISCINWLGKVYGTPCMLYTTTVCKTYLVITENENINKSSNDKTQSLWINDYAHDTSDLFHCQGLDKPAQIGSGGGWRGLFLSNFHGFDCLDIYLTKLETFFLTALYYWKCIDFMALLLSHGPSVVGWLVGRSDIIF